jgi:hypothetical protein
MIKVDATPDQLRAIEIMKHQCRGEFALLSDMIRQNLQRLREQNDARVGTDRDWTQGGCQILRSIDDILTNTNALFKKHNPT